MKTTQARTTKYAPSVAHHRNWISGVPFHAVILRVEDRDMLVVRFGKQADIDTGGAVCAAFDLAKLAERNITFGENSWRGDVYAEKVDRIIRGTK